MLKLEIIDSVSDPGSASHANEDAFGSNELSAFVVDGATGLGNKQYLAGEASDAAWLANHAVEFMKQNLTKNADVRRAISDFIEDAKDTFESAGEGEFVERYAWPSASFVLASVDGDNLILSGLGDCTIFADIAGQIEVFSPLASYASFESDWASNHIQQSGGFGSKKDLLSNPETLASLRAARSLQNTPQSGVWTLGLVPEAANHLETKMLRLANPTYCLLCSDGFSALVDAYDRYNPKSLLETARAKGLKALNQELRHIERQTDPDGHQFPRFKQSDDATAVLMKVGV